MEETKEQKFRPMMVLSVEDVKKIFERISDEDCETMGLNVKWCRPEWLICSVCCSTTTS